MTQHAAGAPAISFQLLEQRTGELLSSGDEKQKTQCIVGAHQAPSARRGGRLTIRSSATGATKSVATPTFSIATRRGLPPNLTIKALEEVMAKSSSSGGNNEEDEDNCNSTSCYLVNVPLGDVLTPAVLTHTGGAGGKGPKGNNKQQQAVGSGAQGQPQAQQQHLLKTQFSCMGADTHAGDYYGYKHQEHAVIYLGYRDILDTGFSSLLEEAVSKKKTAGNASSAASGAGGGAAGKNSTTTPSPTKMKNKGRQGQDGAEQAAVPSSLQHASTTSTSKLGENKVMGADHGENELVDVAAAGASISKEDDTTPKAKERRRSKSKERVGANITSAVLQSVHQQAEDRFVEEPKVVAVCPTSGRKMLASQIVLTAAGATETVAGKNCTDASTPSSSTSTMLGAVDAMPASASASKGPAQGFQQLDVSKMKPILLEKSLHGTQKIAEAEVVRIAAGFDFGIQPAEELNASAGRNRAQRSVERTRDGWKALTQLQQEIGAAQPVEAGGGASATTETRQLRFVPSIQGGCYEGLRVISTQGCTSRLYSTTDEASSSTGRSSASGTTNGDLSVSTPGVSPVAVPAFAIGGLGLGETLADRKKVVATVLSAEDRTTTVQERARFLPICGDMIDVLEFADCIDVFELAFPFLAANQGIALTFVVKMPKDDEKNTSGEKTASAPYSFANVDEHEDYAPIRRSARSWYLDLSDAKCADEFIAVDDQAEFPTEQACSRAYLNHLLNLQELVAYIWLTRHNLLKYRAFFAEIRTHLARGTLRQYREWFYKTHGIQPERRDHTDDLEQDQVQAKVAVPGVRKRPIFASTGALDAGPVEAKEVAEGPETKKPRIGITGTTK